MNVKRTCIVFVLLGLLLSPGWTLAQTDELSVIVRFKTTIDAAEIMGPGIPAGLARAHLITALRAHSRAVQATALALLRSNGVKDVTELWLINGLAVTAPASVLAQVEQLPEVESITPNVLVTPPGTSLAATTTAEWNVGMVRAPELWGAGITGQGAVVAVLDTGVDVNHPDLAANWRGGSNSWFDPNGQHAAPYDAAGHGTQVTGVAVGGSASGTAIGVAPGAQWIAAKIFDDGGVGTYSAIHQAFQWVLDPDGNAYTDDAADVVNNSWYIGNSNSCILEFQSDIQVLKAAGIAVVFAAGNSGPNTSTSVSPANNPDGFAVGAVDSTQNLAYFSSLGPAACDPQSVYPEVVAPGQAVRTADLTSGGTNPSSYITVSGTSFASAHIAGAMALLRSSNPTATVAQLEQALENSASDLGAAGPDNSYGYGLVNLVAANALLEQAPPPNSPPLANNDAATTRKNTAVTIDVCANDVDSDGSIDRSTVTLTSAKTSKGGAVVANVNGTVTFTPKRNFRGTDTFTYTVKDNQGAVSNQATVTVTVK
ncbi:MAG: S8 family serine peptidase [Acidobacteriota bacterium]